MSLVHIFQVYSDLVYSYMFQILKVQSSEFKIDIVHNGLCIEFKIDIEY